MKNDRTAAVARAHAYFDSGGFVTDLRRRVAIPSASQEPERSESLRDYLRDEMTASLTPLGFSPTLLENPLGKGPPFLVATRTEDADFVSVLVYGYGDTIRGLDDLWRPGLSPWLLTIEGDRLYGRGTADNKGQHSINIGALAAVLAERGRLGFNVKLLIEMGEEVGSVGLRELCEQHRDGLLKADLLIASDGPRIAPDQATLFLGARGGHLIDLVVELRDGGHHSGNFGGLLANPGLILVTGLHHRPAGGHPGPGMAAAASRLGAAGARRGRGRHRSGRAKNRSRLGRTRAYAGGAGVRLEQLRGSGLHHRHAGAPGQCHTGAGTGALPASLRGGHGQ